MKLSQMLLHAVGSLQEVEAHARTQAARVVPHPLHRVERRHRRAAGLQTGGRRSCWRHLSSARRSRSSDGGSAAGDTPETLASLVQLEVLEGVHLGVEHSVDAESERFAACLSRTQPFAEVVLCRGWRGRRWGGSGAPIGGCTWR
jgi:hypothetical protein